MKKPKNGSLLLKLSVGAIIFGILMLVAMIAYYALDLGVKPCQGLPTDPTNCGDADFGGVFFILIAAPFLLIGLFGTIIGLVLRITHTTKQQPK